LFQLTLLALFVLLMFIPYPFDPGGEFKLVPGNQVAIRASVPGEIEQVLVKEDQWVTKDQPAVVLVDKDQKARAEAAASAFQEAKEKLTLLRNGPTPEEIARAHQEVNVAAKSLEYTTIEAERSTKQFKDKAISEKDFQAALKARDLDKEKLVLAQKNLEVVKAWPRKEEIRAQEAELKRLEAELTHAQKDLQLTTLLSPIEGRIITAYPAQKIGQYLDVGDLFGVVEDSRVCLAEIEIPEEDIGEVRVGSKVRLRTRAYPTKTFDGKVIAIAPVGYEKSRHRVERVYSEREWQSGQKELIREEGKVIRVLSEFPNTEGALKTDMTGYAKIEGSWMPVGIAFSRWLVRLVMVEIWSWIP
jgi:multidrug resistance efflux pump